MKGPTLGTGTTPKFRVGPCEHSVLIRVAALSVTAPMAVSVSVHEAKAPGGSYVFNQVEHFCVPCSEGLPRTSELLSPQLRTAALKTTSTQPCRRGPALTST